MTLDTNRTVRELALDMPDATRVFERLRIDYCCGGNRTLSDACQSAGVKVEEVTGLLEREAESPDHDGGMLDFQSLSLAELISYIIEKHHVFTTAEMARITALVDKVCGKHGEHHSELIEVGTLFARLCDELRPHMLKEERVLFPYIAVLEVSTARDLAPPFAPFGTVNNPVRMMMFEHDAAGDILRALRDASRDYAVPEDACMSYRALYHALEAFEADLHQHIHLENNVLFPRAVELERATRAFEPACEVTTRGCQ
ncbi:MAG: regulator of cell morphosis and signaling [Acidobacteriota bacterium]|nr:regulator of cell morphosis and signaling [Acidobacteriota bacterium]